MRRFLQEMKDDPQNRDGRIYHSGQRQHKDKAYGYIRFGHVESSVSEFDNRYADEANKKNRLRRAKATTFTPFTTV